MILYDTIIRDILKLTGDHCRCSWPYDSSRVWPSGSEFELLLRSDTAFELGGSGKDAISLTCVTTDSSLIPCDEVLLLGPDLPEISEDTPYARITLLLTGDIESDDDADTDTAFMEIQAMDFVKYHVFPKGFMLRASSQSSREQVRVGKEALSQGMCFSHVGNSLIRQYRENPNVRAVKMIFVTDPVFPYSSLQKLAARTTDITNSLNRILEGMPTECDSCGIREICDEIEGMRELHFGLR